MPNNVISRLAVLELKRSAKAPSILCNWDCGKDDCLLCGTESNKAHNFYLAHSPSATGCTWKEYHSKKVKAGLAIGEYQDPTKAEVKW
ncbi:hypothetical protein AB4302_02820 [Vibrio breoganii]